MLLTARQKMRLTELRRIADRQKVSFDTDHAGACKATTVELETMGLVEIRGRRIASTGRVMHAGIARITEAGRDALAG